MKSEPLTPTSPPDNQFRQMQDELTHIINTSLLNFRGSGRGFLFHRYVRDCWEFRDVVFEDVGFEDDSLLTMKVWGLHTLEAPCRDSENNLPRVTWQGQLLGPPPASPSR